HSATRPINRDPRRADSNREDRADRCSPARLPERSRLFGTIEHRGKHRRPLPRHYGTAPRRPPKVRAALMAAILGYTVLGIFQSAQAVTNTISTVIVSGHFP